MICYLPLRSFCDWWFYDDCFWCFLNFWFFYTWCTAQPTINGLKIEIFYWRDCSDLFLSILTDGIRESTRLIGCTTKDLLTRITRIWRETFGRRCNVFIVCLFLIKLDVDDEKMFFNYYKNFIIIISNNEKQRFHLLL